MPFNFGDHVIVNLEGLENYQLQDFGGQTEMMGTVTDKPGDLYDVTLDYPPSSELSTLANLNEDDLRLEP